VGDAVDEQPGGEQPVGDERGAAEAGVGERELGHEGIRAAEHARGRAGAGAA